MRQVQTRRPPRAAASPEAQTKPGARILCARLCVFVGGTVSSRVGIVDRGRLGWMAAGGAPGRRGRCDRLRLQPRGANPHTTCYGLPSNKTALDHLGL